jgi:hypothetical protein
MSYPKNTRIKAGYELYQRKGTVTILFFDDTMVQAEVTNSQGDTEFVSCILGFWRCTCEDWSKRWKLIPGSFLCKHCLDLLMEISYRLNNGLEMVG